MIVEDYVSFETAKLLKEKGFDEPTLWFYIGDGTRYLAHKPIIGDWYRRPTLQMAMKWLRESHNLCIEPYRTACGYLFTITRIPTGSDIYNKWDDYDGDDEDSGQWTTYEKACEAAITHCLENLI